MAIPRILSGRARLDKLPFWLAVPAGVVIGATVGYKVSMPGPIGRVLWVVVAAAAVVAFAMSAPRPARRERARVRRSDAAEPGRPVPAAAVHDVAGEDSLCD